jgi:hypothetical protein
MDTDLYRRLAADAEQLAHAAKTDTDRKAWLRVAEDWLDLAATDLKNCAVASGHAERSR